MAIFTFIFSLLAPENLRNRVSSKKFNFNFAFQGNSAAKKTPAIMATERTQLNGKWTLHTQASLIGCH